MLNVPRINGHPDPTQSSPLSQEENLDINIKDQFPNIFFFPFFLNVDPTMSDETTPSSESYIDQSQHELIDSIDENIIPTDPKNPILLPAFITDLEKLVIEFSQTTSSGPDLSNPDPGGAPWDQLGNGTSEVLLEMPSEFTEMSQSTLNSVIAYCILFAIAFVGNLTVFFKVLKEYRKQRGRIPLLILHLSVADLIVCSCLIPIEVTWRITIQWYGGTALCKICQFMRAFGLYLSSMVLICVSMDRFWAILYPLKVIEGRRRVKVMLWMAWMAALIFSIPQVIFFNVVSHPKFPSFRQCVTSSFLLDPEDAKLYSIFSVSAMYFAPLGVIIFTYSRILVKLIRKSRESAAGGTSTLRVRPRPLRTLSERHIRRQSPSRKESWRRLRLSLRATRSRTSTESQEDEDGKKASVFETSSTKSTTTKTTTTNPMNSVPRTSSFRGSAEVDGKTHLILRMSGNAVVNSSRARSRTLRMTIVIVLAFVFCWTPYVFMTLWYMFDWKGAKRVDKKIQDGLFLMAVANSCVNPLVYGSFSRNSRYSCGLSKLFACKEPNTTGQFS